MTNFRNFKILLMVFALIGVTSCSEDDNENFDFPSLSPESVGDVVSSNRSLTSLQSAIETAPGDLRGTLTGSATFTVFAPTNEAFAALAAETGYETSADFLAATDADLLAAILTYHVVAGENSADVISQGSVLTTVQGDEITGTASAEGVVQIEDATKLPQTNTEANITRTESRAPNGVVHFIDRVLLPTEAIEALNIDIRPTILDWGKATTELSILVDAIEVAGLTETVEGLDSATVLAPTNEAITALFDQLGEDYESLKDFDNAAEIAVLRDIMIYHVLPGSPAPIAGQTETALEGNSVEVVSANGGFTFGDATDTDAKTVEADIIAKNGSVQIIDKILLPETALDFEETLQSDDLTTTVATNFNLSILADAIRATELEDTFADTTNESFEQREDESDEDFLKRSAPDNYTYFKPATVFAPTNAAFAKLFQLLGNDYADIADFDTEEELELLESILLYHVVDARVASEDLTSGSVSTAAGSDIEVIAAVGSDSVVIGDASNNVNANLTTPDVFARNGIAHIVDKVLLSKTTIDFINTLKEGETEEEGN